MNSAIYNFKCDKYKVCVYVLGNDGVCYLAVSHVPLLSLTPVSLSKWILHSIFPLLSTLISRLISRLISPSLCTMQSLVSLRNLRVVYTPGRHCSTDDILASFLSSRTLFSPFFEMVRDWRTHALIYFYDSTTTYKVF